MVSRVAELAATAKLTKYLECKHEQAAALVTCDVSGCKSEQWQICAKFRFLERESLRIRRRGVGAMACFSAATLAVTQIHPNCLPPPSLWADSFQNSPFTGLTAIRITLYNVNPSSPAQFHKSRLLAASAQSQIWQIYPKRSGAEAIKTSQSRIECQCRCADPGSVGNREPKTSWCSFMTVAGNSGKFTHEMLTKSRFWR